MYIMANTQKNLIIMPIILTIGGLVYGILGKNIYLILLSLGLFLCMIIAPILKSLMPVPPEHEQKTDIYLRPCNNKHNSCDCGFYSSKSTKKNQIGMPSEHAMTMMFFATMIYLRYGQVNYQVVFSMILALVVMSQRYFSHCHSILQLFAGSALGIMFAWIYNYIIMMII